MQKNINKERLLIVLGMTFFWAMFRHPTVMQRMFPMGKSLSFGSLDVPLFAIFLAILFGLGVVAFCLARKIEAICVSQKPVILVVSVLGSLGIIMSFTGAIPGEGSFWVSTTLFALSFIALYLAWATYFSQHYSLEIILILSVSYLMSLLLFNVLGTYLPTLRMFLIEIIPFVCGLCFYLLPTSENVEEEARSAKDIAKHKLAYVVLFIAFLLTGSLTRGIVDIMNNYSAGALFHSARWIVSLVIASIICFMCAYRYWVFSKRIDGDGDICENVNVQKLEYAEGEQLTLFCWVSLVVFFFTGLAVIAVGQSYGLGGHIVVSARSSLDFLLWVLLCSIATSERLRVGRLFLLCGVLTEIVSWVISYLFIPAVAIESTEFFASSGGRSVLFSLFFLLAILTLTLGALSLNRERAAISRLTEAPQQEPEGLSPEIIAKYKLSKREAEIAWLFAQGYSLSKVASALFISMGTAQSHIKSVYRKLDVHNKNELIELINK